jgi:hypothetical protein
VKRDYRDFLLKALTSHGKVDSNRLLYSGTKERMVI